MTESERKDILAKLRASAKEARVMTPDEARSRLASGGFCDERGRLTRSYGGKAAIRG
jgi:hypothetical protein